jgi:hypothetical protein
MVQFKNITDTLEIEIQIAVAPDFDCDCDKNHMGYLNFNLGGMT